MKLSVLLLNSHGGIYQVNKCLWKACLIFDYCLPLKNHLSLLLEVSCVFQMYGAFLDVDL